MQGLARRTKPVPAPGMGGGDGAGGAGGEFFTTATTMIPTMIPTTMRQTKHNMHLPQQAGGFVKAREWTLCQVRQSNADAVPRSRTCQSPGRV